jgi:hypothetical protein
MRAGIHSLVFSLLNSVVFLLLVQVTAASGTAGPLTKVQILGLLAGGVSNERITSLVKERGIDFQPTPTDLGEVRHAGADRMLLVSLRAAARESPARSAVGGMVVSPHAGDRSEGLKAASRQVLY